MPGEHLEHPLGIERAWSGGTGGGRGSGELERAAQRRHASSVLGGLGDPRQVDQRRGGHLEVFDELNLSRVGPQVVITLGAGRCRLEHKLGP